MHHPTDRIAYTMAFVTPVVEHWLEREIAQWVHPMNDRSDNPSHHERTLLPRSYISLLEISETEKDVVALHLPTGPLETCFGFELVTGHEPSTYQPINH